MQKFKQLDIKLESPCVYYDQGPKKELTGSLKNMNMIHIPKSCFKNEEYHVEFQDVFGNWYSLLGFEDDYKKMEEFIKTNKSSTDESVKEAIEAFNQELSFVRKYRSSQKRFKYTKEQFEEFFNVVPDKKEKIANETLVFFNEEDKEFLFVWPEGNKSTKLKSHYTDIIGEAQCEFQRFLNSLV